MEMVKEAVAEVVMEKLREKAQNEIEAYMKQSLFEKDFEKLLKEVMQVKSFRDRIKKKIQEDLKNYIDEVDFMEDETMTNLFHKEIEGMLKKRFFGGK